MDMLKAISDKNERIAALMETNKILRNVIDLQGSVIQDLKMLSALLNEKIEDMEKPNLCNSCLFYCEDRLTAKICSKYMKNSNMGVRLKFDKWEKVPSHEN